jgi:hypothetical protein
MAVPTVVWGSGRTRTAQCCQTAGKCPGCAGKSDPREHCCGDKEVAILDSSQRFTDGPERLFCPLPLQTHSSCVLLHCPCPALRQHKSFSLTRRNKRRKRKVFLLHLLPKEDRRQEVSIHSHFHLFSLFLKALENVWQVYPVSQGPEKCCIIVPVQEWENIEMMSWKSR